MAGKVVVSTLNDDTGVLATQNGMTGIAKAWVTFDGASPTIIASYNVGSVTKNGTGDYNINFTTAMPNADYTCTGNATINLAQNAFATVFPWANPSSPFYAAPSTTSFRVMTSISNVGNNRIDPQRVGIAVFSS
jgi:hypothetical protein